MKILEIKRESCPAARFIGKKYASAVTWGEWWENGWFDVLEAQPGLLAINDDGYIGAKRIVDGALEYWIGMFFEAGAAVPDGFDHVDIEPLEYAVCYLYGNPENGELFGLEPHNICLEELEKSGYERRHDDWCFERYNCPRWTDPDEQGNAVLDYAISVKK